MKAHTEDEADEQYAREDGKPREILLLKLCVLAYEKQKKTSNAQSNPEYKEEMRKIRSHLPPNKASNAGDNRRAQAAASGKSRMRGYLFARPVHPLVRLQSAALAAPLPKITQR